MFTSMRAACPPGPVATCLNTDHSPLVRLCQLAVFLTCLRTRFLQCFSLSFSTSVSPCLSDHCYHRKTASNIFSKKIFRNRPSPRPPATAKPRGWRGVLVIPSSPVSSSFGLLHFTPPGKLLSRTPDARGASPSPRHWHPTSLVTAPSWSHPSLARFLLLFSFLQASPCLPSMWSAPGLSDYQFFYFSA